MQSNFKISLLVYFLLNIQITCSDIIHSSLDTRSAMYVTLPNVNHLHKMYAEYFLEISHVLQERFLRRHVKIGSTKNPFVEMHSMLICAFSSLSEVI